MPEQLEIAAHGVTAILATWLGLVVLTRSGDRRGARVFALLAACLVVWSVAIITQRLTSQPEVVGVPMNALEDVAAFLLPAATLHIALVLAVEGRRSAVQQLVLTATYALSAVMALGAVFFPDQQLRVSPPHLVLPGLPGPLLGWAWIGVRVFIFFAAQYWIVRALMMAGGDSARRQQLLAALATVMVGAAGGILRFLPGPADDAPWLGVILITLAVVVAAYAVFAQGIFVLPEAAARAFRYSVAIGLGVTLYVTAVLALERGVQDALGLDLPIVTALALVATLALFDPVSAWFRHSIGAPSGRDAARVRLRQALGLDPVTSQAPEGVVAPALARLVRALDLRGAATFAPTGEEVARHGEPDGESPLAIRLPLSAGAKPSGSLVVGPKASGLPLTAREVDLLSEAARFIGASLDLGARHSAQADALDSLSADGAAVHAHGVSLDEAIIEASSQPAGLQVFALGPLRVVRDGEALVRWGGAKAGTRQAEAVFAFLFDRGERGVAKAEVVEMIWPDVDLERADLAFHRTLNGLRTTLEPGRRGGERAHAITFHNDRYRLDPSVVSWSDVDAFDEAMAAASAPRGTDDAIPHLERARALYRGEFLDDCPFYGDSAEVEERRGLLRRRCVDLLLALGERYEQRGDRPAAAASFRQARSIFGEELPSADAALLRLGVPA